jgi:hypothetical protein
MKNVSTIVLLLWATQSFAFEIKEHKKITELAFDTTKSCLTGEKPTRALSDFVVREDWNLARKWFGCCSHYYKPPAGMLSRRQGGEARVKRLTEELAQEISQRTLGFYLHHLQDVASPPHTIPIEHGASDKFESYQSDQSLQQIQTLTCAQLRESPRIDLFALYEETAQTTKISMSQSLTATINNEETTLSWNFFFTPSQKHKLNKDLFGTERFTLSGESYHISRREYERYKQQQLVLAVQATQRAIYETYLRTN